MNESDQLDMKRALDAAVVRELTLRAEVAQLRQAYALWQESMRHVTEDRDEKKHANRTLTEHCVALEAARDHLRARLRQLSEFVQHKDNCPQAYDAKWARTRHVEQHLDHEDMFTCPDPVCEAWTKARRLRWNKVPCNCGLADLLAVLTEPQNLKNDEKPNENEARSAETDVTREVALPQPPTESHS